MYINDFKNLPLDISGYFNIKDKNFRLQWISKMWIKPLGFSHQDELIGKKTSEIPIFTDEMKQQYEQTDRQAFDGDNWFGIQETIFVKKGRIHLLTSKAPLYDNNKNIMSVIVMDVPLLGKKGIQLTHFDKKFSETICR